EGRRLLMAAARARPAWMPGALLALAPCVLALGAPVAQAADRRPALVPPAIERRTQAGPPSLARTQNRDGSWNNMGGWGTYPVAMTALAGTALLMDGSTPTQGPHSKSVRKAAEFLVRAAQPRGLIATPGEEGRSLHGHSVPPPFLSHVHRTEER